MPERHESLRVDFEAICEELDGPVEEPYGVGSDRGLIGLRMQDGGSGGSIVSPAAADSAGNGETASKNTTAKSLHESSYVL